MATFTLTITVPQVQAPAKDPVAIAEVLRNTADVVERQLAVASSYTMTDRNYPQVTRSSWTYA